MNQNSNDKNYSYPEVESKLIVAFEKLAEICQAHDIPMLITAAISNDEDETKYILASASSQDSGAFSTKMEDLHKIAENGWRAANLEAVTLDELPIAT